MRALNIKLVLLKTKSKINKILTKVHTKKLPEQEVLLKNLNMLMDRGYSINECVSLLGDENSKYILNNFLEGQQLSKSLAELGFDKDVLLIIEISEEGGRIEEGIKRSHQIIKQKISNKSKIYDKLKYPLLLSIILVFALLFISNFLIPMFMRVYSSFNIETDGFMQIFINTLIVLPKVVIIVIIISLIIALYLKAIEDSDRLKLLFKNKILQRQYLKLYNDIFVINIHSLLNFGVKLNEIFLILSQQDHNYYLKKQSQIIHNKLNEGEDLVNILEQQKIYDQKTINAIRSGLETNSLIEDLYSIILFTQVKKEQKMSKIIMLIQPIIYMFFGLVIVLLYMSIFIPMFKIMDSI